MSRLIDLTGQRFGKLVVIRRAKNNYQSSARWFCQCDCGNKKVVLGGALRDGRTSSCGCNKAENLTGKQFGELTVLSRLGTKNGQPTWLCRCSCGNVSTVRTQALKEGRIRRCNAHSKSKDLTGQRFGRLTALKPVKALKDGSFIWLCKCQCGNYKKVKSGNLKSGGVKSCGCLLKEKTIPALIKANKNPYEFRFKDLKEGTSLGHLNKRIPKNNKTGVKGVWFNKPKKMYVAELHFKGKRMLCKSFVNKQDAINARKEAEEKYFKPILEKYKNSHSCQSD